MPDTIAGRLKYYCQWGYSMGRGTHSPYTYIPGAAERLRRPGKNFNTIGGSKITIAGGIFVLKSSIGIIILSRYYNTYTPRP